MRTLVFALLFSAHLRAQISGRVLDPTGQPISGAQVRAVRRDSGVAFGAKSDAQGRFRLDRAPAGEYLIQAETPELDLSAPAAVSAPGEAELRLALRAVAQRINITAESAPLSADEVAKALTVVDRSELENRHVVSIFDALRTVPGLRVQQLGGPGGLTRVLTRGLRARDTAILIDGFRFRDAAAPEGDALAFLSDLTVVNTDRVEVLRGSGSSLYGTHAMGGAINIVSDQGGGASPGGLRGDLSADGGGLGMMRGVARLSGSAFEDRFRFSGGLAHVNVTRGVDGDDRWRNTSGQVWWQYFPRASTSVSARFWGNDTFLGINNNPASVPLAQLPGATVVPAIPGITFVPNVNDPDRRRASNFGSTLLTLNHTAAPWANLRVNWQHLQSQRDDQNGPAGTGFQPVGYRTVSGFVSGIDTVQARADLTPARWQQFAVGYEFERESFESPSFDENPVEARRVNANALADQRSHALFLQSQTRWKDRLILGASGRAQFFSLSRPTFTGGFPTYNNYSPSTPPNAYTGDGSIAYVVPKTGTKLRAHVGNAYRAPSLYERFGTFFFGGAFSALGDPRLAPERSIAADAGIDQYLFGSRLRLGATYFYTRLQQVIGFGNLRSDPFGRFSGYVNTDGALARGVEISGETKPWRGMNLSSSYTYTNADERRSSLLGGGLRSIRVFPHAFTLVAIQQIGRRANVAFDFLGASDYVSGSFFVGGGSRPFLFPGPRRGNLAASYTVPLSDRSSIQFFARVENVFNQEYFEDGFRTPKAWAVGGLKWKF